MVQRGHALRVTTRGEAGRAGVEATGAECWIGTPDRLATLRGALDSVTVACWMLAGARGAAEEFAALHSSRLEFFLGQAIDTTVRGFVYDAWPACGGDVAGGAGGADLARVSGEILLEGAQIVRSLAQLNAIPAVVLVPGSASGAGDAGSGAEERGAADDRADDRADDADSGEEADEAWLAAAARAVDELLGGGPGQPASA
jgi:hypothetical protein